MKKTQKQVTVIAVYKFRQISRICFETLSSDGATHYHTCFDGSAEKSSCTCPGGQSFRGNCYHQDGLRARAALYFESRQPAKVEQVLTAEDIADLVDPDIEVMQPVKKVDPMTEAQAFIARAQAAKATARQQEDWSTPNGSLYRETRNYETVNGRACPMR